MASQPDVLQSCLLKAAKAAKPALAHCIDEAVAALQAAETKAVKVVDRDELSSAWRLLAGSKDAWLASWQVALQDAFSRDAQPSKADRASGRKSLTAAFSPSSIAALESLSLVNDTDVTQAIERAPRPCAVLLRDGGGRTHSAEGGAHSGSAPLHDPGRGDDASYRAVPAVDRPNRLVDVSSPLSPQVWGAYGRSRERAIGRTQLKKEATKVGQVLGLEVVRKLVNQVAQDPRLLVPVREAIVALEPSLLRLPMVDPRFFSNEGHPG